MWSVVKGAAAFSGEPLMLGGGGFKGTTMLINEGRLDPMSCTVQYVSGKGIIKEIQEKENALQDLKTALVNLYRTDPTDPAPTTAYIDMDFIESLWSSSGSIAVQTLYAAYTACKEELESLENHMYPARGQTIL